MGTDRLDRGLAADATAAPLGATAPGTVTPRLASLYAGGTGVVVGDQLFEVTARPYQDLAAVDFDRDGRDTLTLSSGDATHPFTSR
ncbi:MAG: hypothetical protein IPQ07_23590 [Myxococcales bacterium]|nr:hypothetical protein [Myxococcales bacterium]